MPEGEEGKAEGSRVLGPTHRSPHRCSALLWLPGTVRALPMCCCLEGVPKGVCCGDVLWRAGIMSPVAAPTWLQGFSYSGQGQRLRVIRGSSGYPRDQKSWGKEQFIVNSGFSTAFQNY